MGLGDGTIGATTGATTAATAGRIVETVGSDGFDRRELSRSSGSA